MVVVTRIALVAVAVVLLGAAGFGAAGGAGPARHPDLRTLRPSELFFDALDDGTRVLRFSNTVWNPGPGRLEMEGDPSPQQGGKAIYQNVYDNRGNRVDREQVNSDFVYHPTHEHFHFADFANYRLLRQDRRGGYRPAAQQQQFGEKTGFCIMDSRPVASPAQPTYSVCDGAVQGLSVGWGDVYDYTLDDQWVELRRGLKDGEYALVSTADPNNKLDEGGGEYEENNTATAYFTVRGGLVADVRGKP
ncbi:MAG: hypothetical protein AVDCRST_MAG88-3986 [uncultured Thermomicrobiales bacterium]|uniref:Lysyl oxidase n=1 Tax=uncultured Thermomicrobiales bacterium TaxID=1645740 RepID=A0A6J4VRV2_9BACT|nr:MAG: hypothetical protein AVDCRST_MAG88-3986 [uncultured Thermomicrobiales bacterium]